MKKSFQTGNALASYPTCALAGLVRPPPPGMCTNMYIGDFCDVVMKCLVTVLQTNFPTGTNQVSISLITSSFIYHVVNMHYERGLSSLSSLDCHQLLDIKLH